MHSTRIKIKKNNYNKTQPLPYRNFRN